MRGLMNLIFSGRLPYSQDARLKASSLLKSNICIAKHGVQHTRWLSSGLRSPYLERLQSTFPVAATQEDLYEEEATIKDVPWTAELANAVSLIGRLGSDIEVKTLTQYQVANCRLGVSSGKKKLVSWFDLEVWGDLAKAAAEQLHKGDQVQVLGRLRSSEWQGRSKVSVSVSSISRVREDGQSLGHQDWVNQEVEHGPGYDDQTTTWGNEAEVPTMSRQAQKEQQWTDLVNNLSEYWDNRTNKRNPKAPDFKHKKLGTALWLNSAPKWVHDELSNAASPF